MDEKDGRGSTVEGVLLVLSSDMIMGLGLAGKRRIEGGEEGTLGDKGYGCLDPSKVSNVNTHSCC